MRTVRIGCQDGLRLAVRIWGDWRLSRQMPLLCMPGLSRNGADFRGLAEALAPRRVVALDLIGRGLADRAAAAERYGPERLLDDIRHATAALGLYRVVAVGTSFGGLLAMALAVSQPNLLAGTVINDVGPDAGEGVADAWLEIVANPPSPASWDEAIAYLRRIAPNLSLADDAAWREFAETTFEPRRDGASGLLAQWDRRIAEPLLAPEKPPDLWALFRAAAARGPMLVVQGGASDVLSAATLAKMAAAAPHAETLSLPGIGHAPTLTEPDALAAIRQLLARCDRG